MDFTLSEEQQQLKALIKDFCKKEVDQKSLSEASAKTAAARSIQELRAAYPYEILEKLHNAGIRQMQIPQKYGGTAPETDVNLTLTIAAEELGYWGGSIVDPIMIPWLFLRAVATNHYVTEEQRKWIFSRFIENPRLIVATSVTEPAGGTDIHLPYDEGGGKILQVTAFEDGDEWVINGDKMYCSNCGAADLIMVAARTNKNAPVSEAMTFFWVPTDSPGLSISPNKMIAMEFGGNCQTYYDNVRIPKANMIGQVNKGFSIINSFFEAHLPGASGLTGIMRRLNDQMRDYARERYGGGRPIIQHTGIAGKLGEVAINLESLRTMFYRGAWEIDRAQESGASAQQSNLFWFLSNFVLFKQLAWRFCEVASDIYGGMSASVDLPIGSFMNHIFYQRSAGLTVSTELIRACQEYDERYRSF